MGDLIPLESAVVARITRLLTSRKAWWVKTTGVTKAGCPDLLACYRGRFIAIEVKRPSIGVVSAKQAHELRCINDAGGEAYVATHEDDVRQVLDDIDTELELDAPR